MSDLPRRGITLADVMVLVATAPGFMLLRTAVAVGSAEELV